MNFRCTVFLSPSPKHRPLYMAKHNGQLDKSGLGASACDHLEALNKSLQHRLSGSVSHLIYFLVQFDHSVKNTQTETKFSPRSPRFWFDYPHTIPCRIISLVLETERQVVHFEDSSFTNPFFFPQNVTVEGECVTARRENALQTVLKFLLAQTAQLSVRRLSWQHQNLILLLYLRA